MAVLLTEITCMVAPNLADLANSPRWSHSARRAVFLDRDGVLNRTVVRGNTTHPPGSLAEFELLPGVPEALRRLASAGFALIVVTNQPDVARGTQTIARLEEIHDHLRTTLPLLDVLACLHDNGDGCTCRKPRPGMLLEAAQRWQLDLRCSFLVGDRWSDVAAGQAVGCRTVLVETPYSGRERCVPDYVVTNLSEAADWILACRTPTEKKDARCLAHSLKDCQP